MCVCALHMLHFLNVRGMLSKTKFLIHLWYSVQRRTTDNSQGRQLTLAQPWGPCSSGPVSFAWQGLPEWPAPQGRPWHAFEQPPGCFPLLPQHGGSHPELPARFETTGVIAQVTKPNRLIHLGIQAVSCNQRLSYT